MEAYPNWDLGSPDSPDRRLRFAGAGRTTASFGNWVSVFFHLLLNFRIPLLPRGRSNSAAILIGAEVFGAAFAGSWAIATLLGLGTIGARLLDGLFVLCGIIVMVLFVRSARRIEPFVADEHRPVRR